MTKQNQPILDEGPRDDAVGKHVCESDIASKFLGQKFSPQLATALLTLGSALRPTSRR